MRCRKPLPQLWSLTVSAAGFSLKRPMSSPMRKVPIGATGTTAVRYLASYEEVFSYHCLPQDTAVRRTWGSSKPLR